MCFRKLYVHDITKGRLLVLIFIYSKSFPHHFDFVFLVELLVFNWKLLNTLVEDIQIV